MSVLDDAIAAQNRASDPARSTWVSANAGSGKTRVLTDRVARLLLADTPPQNILCLTFTKAAAAEMQSRLFRRLGDWAMLEDDALRDVLTAIGETDLPPKRLSLARQLFARALETPGGLKIQTIHAFCAALLRRFPLEAGVSPRFQEIDDRDAALLRSEVVDSIGRDAPEHLAAIAPFLSDEGGFDDLLLEVLKSKADLLATNPAVLARTLNVVPGTTRQSIATKAMADIKRDTLQSLADAFRKDGKKTDQDNADLLFAALNAKADEDLFEAAAPVFLTKDGAPKKTSRFPTGSVKTAHPWVEETVTAIMTRIDAAREEMKGVDTLARSSALAGFAKVFITRYTAAKAQRGVLDFDDLIEKAEALLTHEAVADWVLYRMDGGLDHILVDEAQDTSPRQWSVVRALASEITAGQGAREDGRTIFVVGDRKQSIFGFQGADPRAFSQTQDHFGKALAGHDQSLQDVGLLVSFRTAAPILALVDAAFADGAGGTPADGHRAFPERPGRVDIWPFRAPEKDTKIGSWWEPVDTMREDKPQLILATKMAEDIAEKITTGVQIPDAGGWRPITPGDIMVLVRSRGAFFFHLIAELKRLGVQVAGSDRIRLGEELAVKDVLSVLRFLDLDSDDLSLAEALRSPLFGLSEGDLYSLAYNRPGTLWEALTQSGHSDALDRLNALRARVDFERPFDLIHDILERDGGRLRLIARLGPDCADALDELCAQALTFEGANTPSLSGFLRWINLGDQTVKREQDGGASEVRIMSVHGSKGLEAPVVYLPDVVGQRTPKVHVLADKGSAFWAGKVSDLPASVGALRDSVVEAEKEEQDRLLYVAATRAESWLILCGAGQPAKDETTRWHGKLKAALATLTDAESLTTDNWLDARATPGRAPAQAAPTGLPQSLVASLPPRPATRDPLRPSQMEGPHALPGDPGDAEGLARGTDLHLLLQHLPDVPKPDRRARAAQLVETPDAYLAEAEALLDAPALAHVFAPDALVEVPFSVWLPERDLRVNGIMDRVLVGADDTHIIDIKSNRITPEKAEDTPAGILRQMAAYHAAARQIWPQKAIRLSILWTKDARLMDLPHKAVTQSWPIVSST